MAIRYDQIELSTAANNVSPTLQAKSASSSMVRINTAYGYIELGPENNSHCHIQTDLSNFYFNKEIRVNSGAIGSYDEDLDLRRAGSSKITAGENNIYIKEGIRIQEAWGQGDYSAEQLSIVGSYPSICLRSDTQNHKWLMHHDGSDHLQLYQGDQYDNNTWTKRFTFHKSGQFEITKASGSIIQTGASSDAFGYNASYGHYIAGNGGTYVYGNGSLHDGTANRTILHTGNYGSYVYSESESDARFTSKDHFRSTGTGYYTSTTTSALLTEALGDGAFNSYLTAHKTGWSYAGNGNLTDAGRLTELAGTSWLWWTDNSTDAQQGNVTALCIAPNTGGSANKVFIYNNQGSGYSPGWREVWTSASDGSGSGLDADKVDGLQASQFLRSDANDSTSGTLDVNGGSIKITGDASNIANLKLSEGGVDNHVILEYDGTGSGATNYFHMYSGISGWATKGSSFNMQPNTGNVNIGATNFGYKFRVDGTTYLGKTTIVGTANGNDPTLKITSTTSNSFNHAIEAFNSNLTSGEANIVLFGKEGNTKNSGYIGYEWAGAGSNNNFVTIGHWGANHLFRVYPDQTTTGTSFRAPIFYDVDNTGYYIDPASTSTLNQCNANGFLVNGTYDGLFGFTGMSWGGSTTYPTLYSGHSDRWVMHLKPHIVWAQNGQRGFTGTTTGSMIRFEGNLASDRQWDIGCLTSIASGGDYWGVSRRISGANTWAFYADPSHNLHANTSMRAPIFYDSNNTGYYVDPSTTGRSINVNGYITAANGNEKGFEIGSGGCHLTAAGLGEAVFQGNSQIRFGPNNWDYNQWGGIKYTGGSSPVLYIGGPSSGHFTSNSNPPNAVVDFVGVSYVNTASSFRAPIFYDSDNTARYLNPAGDSILSHIRLHNHCSLESSHGRGFRFWNSNSYKIHMSGSTQSTHGGRVAGETTSDYNMYFTMSGGTNRGFVFKNANSSSGGNCVAGIDASGNGRFTGDVIAYSSSDKRLKDNITPIENPIDKVQKISGVTFDWNDKQDTYEHGKHDVGVIAQEIEEVLPEVVDTRENGYKAVKYEKIVPLLIEAIKEQQKQIDELKKLINP